MRTVESWNGFERVDGDEDICNGGVDNVLFESVSQVPQDEGGRDIFALNHVVDAVSCRLTNRLKEGKSSRWARET